MKALFFNFPLQAASTTDRLCSNSSSTCDSWICVTWYDDERPLVSATLSTTARFIAVWLYSDLCTHTRTHTHTFHCLPICARPVQYCQYIVSGATKLLMLSNLQKKLMIQLSWICIDVQSGQLIMHRVYWTTLDYYIQTDHEHLLVSEHQ